MNQKHTYSKTDLVAAISILLIGTDRYGINLGVNLRIDQFFILLLFILLLYQTKAKIRVFKPALCFGAISFVSALFALDFSRGMVYYSNIFFNVFITFEAYALYVYINGIEKTIQIYRITMYIQFVLIVLQMILGYQGRTLLGLSHSGYWHGFVRIPLWFYEPAYLATYLVIWTSISMVMFIVYGDKSYIKDLVFSVVAIIITTSTVGYIGIVICLAMTYILLLLERKVSIKTVLLVPIVVVIIYYFSKTEIYRVFVGRINTQGIDIASGGRTVRWSETLEVFYKHWLLGVGPGNYGIYLNRNNDYVPSNVTLEIMATLGITGTISFYYFNIKLIVSMLKNTSSDVKFRKALAVSLISFLIVLQANQNYLRLYHWMLLGIICGLSFTNRNINKERRLHCER